MSTSINLSPSTVFELISNVSGRNSTTVKISGECTSFVKPSITVTNFPQIGNKVTVSLGDINVRPLSGSYVYECDATITAKDDVTAKDLNINFSADSQSYASLIINHIRLYPHWTIQESLIFDVKQLSELTATIKINDEEDFVFEEIHSAGITSVDTRGKGEVAFTTSVPVVGRKDKITLMNTATDTYASKSMTCNISYTFEQTWEVSSEFGTFSTIDTSTKTITIDDMSLVHGAIDVYSKTSGGEIDKSEKGYLNINTNGLNFGSVLVSLSSSGQDIEYSATDTFVIFAAGDDDYESKEVKITFTITREDKLSRNLRVVNSPTSDTKIYSKSMELSAGSTDIIVKYSGTGMLYTNEYQYREPSISPTAKSITTEDPGYTIFTITPKSTGAFEYTFNMPESDGYSADKTTFTLNVKDSRTNPDPIEKDPGSVRPKNTGYRIKRNELPNWHCEYSTCITEADMYVDIARCCISKFVDNESTISFPNNYFKYTNDPEFAFKFAYYDTAQEGTTLLNKYFTATNLDLKKSLILSGSRPLCKIAYEDRILKNSNITEIKIKRNDNSISVEYVGGTTKPLERTDFYDYSIPKKIYMLLCGSGGNSGEGIKSYQPSYMQCGLAGGGGAGALLELDLTGNNTEFKLEYTYESLKIVNTQDSTKYIAVGNGENGSIVKYVWDDGYIQDTMPAASNGGKITHSESLPDKIKIITSANGGDTNISDEKFIQLAVKDGGPVLRTGYNEIEFPGGTYFGGKSGYESLYACGNGGGASFVSNGGDFGYYFNSGTQIIHSLAFNPGAGAGGVGYYINLPASVPIQHGGPAYFAILY